MADAETRTDLDPAGAALMPYVAVDAYHRIPFDVAQEEWGGVMGFVGAKTLEDGRTAFFFQRIGDATPYAVVLPADA